MTKPHLRACPACARHVRVSEASCPFCGGILDQAFRASPAPRSPGARLTRAALFAFGTGTLALAPGCSSSQSTELNDAGYGGSPFDAPSILTGDDAGDGSDATEPSKDAPSSDAPIGDDAGDSSQPIGDDAGDSSQPIGDDAGDATFLADAAYGATPFDSGHD